MQALPKRSFVLQSCNHQNFSSPYFLKWICDIIVSLPVYHYQTHIILYLPLAYPEAAT